MNIKAAFDGEEREFQVLKLNETDAGFKHIRPTHYFDGTSEVRSYADYKYSAQEHSRFSPRLYLRLIRKRHTFGGVVFEETGETRAPQKDEWFTNGNDLVHYTFHGEYSADYTILRPVSPEA